MSDGETPEKDAKTGRFKSGNIGGPGRPRGARNKLTELFLKDLLGAWETKGAEAIQRVIEEKPSDFLKIVAGLMPQKVEVSRPEGEMTDAELADALDKLDGLLAFAKSAGGHAGSADGGEGTSRTTH